jgi:hypothetical protein
LAFQPIPEEQPINACKQAYGGKEMPWENLAQLSKPIEMKAIDITGPGKTVLAAVAPAQTPKIAPNGLTTASGAAPTPAPAEAVAFANKQANAVRLYTVDPKVRMLGWFNDAMTQSKENLDTFVQATMTQLNKGINEQSLTTAQVVLNELSRTPAGSAAVRRQLTAPAIAKIILTSKGRA